MISTERSSQDSGYLPAALKLIIAIVICVLPGLAGSLLTDTGSDSWYQQIEKPAFQPPGWVFGPVWSTLYVAMGVALYLIWTRGDGSRHWQRLIVVFAVQLILNALWTPAFFGLESPELGLLVIIPLLLLIGVTIVMAWRYSQAAALLLVPYLGWVSFATLLTFSIWRLN